jgi:hypothetical protein
MDKHTLHQIKTVVFISILFFLSVHTVCGIPNGLSVSAIGNNNVTFSANSAESEAWFEYGMTPATLVVWTQNVTAGGAYTWTEIGSPLTSSEKYYVAACDQDGCSATTTFTMLAMTPIPLTTYGYIISNASENRFNPIIIASNTLAPYAWIFPTTAQGLGISIVTALLLFAVFFGLAIRTRSVVVPIVIGLISAPYFLYSNQGLLWGIPPEFTAVAQGITYACVAGILLVILK